ncbi:hypothetical protein N9985_00445 [Gammaproteobacteria bacterium]|nr:hypothetical protein [Gammaproteobacteria bacterium]
MTKQSSVFRTIWRINAVLLLLAGIGSLLIILVNLGLFKLFEAKEPAVNRRTIDIGEVDDTAVITDQWFLGRLKRIAGSEYFYLPLKSEEVTAKKKSSGSAALFSSGSSGNTRNLLFIDPLTDSSTWLYPSNDQLISNVRVYTTHSEAKATSRDRRKQNEKANVNAVGIMYTIIDNDSNGDGKLTGADKPSLAVSAPNGADYKVLLKDVDRILGDEIIEDDTLFIALRSNGVGSLVKISLRDKRIISEQKLPHVQGSEPSIGEDDMAPAAFP